MSDSNFVIKGTCLIKYIGNERDVIVPDGITRISGNCFSMSKIETITLPETVEEIGQYAFAYCRHLSWINLVNGIKSIGDNAFYGCINIKLFYIDCDSTETATLFLPKNLEYLGKYAFAGLNIEMIKFKGTNITTISKHCFAYCCNLHSVYLPNCLVEIESCAFEGNRSLKTLYIPNSVKHIGSRAFYKCLSLVYVDLGDGISEIPYGIFEECSSLGYIKFGNGIVSIGDCAFKNCRTLNNVELNETCLRKIGNRSFEDCKNLNRLALPKSLKEIGNWTFRRTEIKVEDLPYPMHIGKTHKSFSELWHDVIYPFDDVGNLTEDAKRLASFGLVFSNYTRFHVGGWFSCSYNPDKRAPDFEVRQVWSSKRIVLSKEDNPEWADFSDSTPIEELEFLQDVKSFDYEIFIKSRWWEFDKLKYKKSIGEIEFYPTVVKRFIVPAERLEIAEALKSLYGDRVTIKQSDSDGYNESES